MFSLLAFAFFPLLHFFAYSRQEDREFVFAVQMQEFVDHVLIVDAECAGAGIKRFAREVQIFHDRADVDQDLFVGGDVVLPFRTVRDAAPGEDDRCAFGEVRYERLIERHFVDLCIDVVDFTQVKQFVAVRQITVDALLQSLHIEDEKIGFEGMCPAAAWNGSESDAGAVGAGDGLRAPQQVGQFVQAERVFRIVADAPSVLDDFVDVFLFHDCAIDGRQIDDLRICGISFDVGRLRNPLLFIRFDRTECFEVRFQEIALFFISGHGKTSVVFYHFITSCE